MAQATTSGFTPPSMLGMPWSSEAARRAEQEDAWFAWHEAQAQRRAGQNVEAVQSAPLDRAIARQPHAFTSFSGHCPNTPVAGDETAGLCPSAPAVSHMPGLDALLSSLASGRAA